MKEGSWVTGSLFFDYELQITNYGEGRNLVVGRCATRTDSVCVCVSDSFFNRRGHRVSREF